MSGERTPDTSPPSKSGSSDDEISLREHLQRQIDLQRQNGIQMFEQFRLHYDAILEERSLIWNTRIDDLNRLLDERYASHLKQTDDSLAATHRAREAMFASLVTMGEERDKRHEQRFNAQETATSLALARVDKEFHEHLQSARQETHAALEAADKAITKSETATGKQFESVNEFRAQLADLIRGFMPRGESEVRMQAIAERVELNASALNTGFQMQSERINKLELNLQSRLDLTAGKSTGVDKTVAWVFAGAGFLSTIVALFAYFSK